MYDILTYVVVQLRIGDAIHPFFVVFFVFRMKVEM